MRSFSHMLLLASMLAFLAPVASVQADAFDWYTNPVLRDAVESKKWEPVKELPLEKIVDAGGVLPNQPGAFLVVYTNEHRWAKLLVQPGRQKVNEKLQVPLLLIDRFVTYREATERAILAEGKNIQLYAGMHFHLDLGQVVPPKVGGDLHILEDEKDPTNFVLKPLGKAQLYLVTQALPNVVPKKLPKLEIGEVFEIRYFNGKYKLFDDGRRSGDLILKVDEQGIVTGDFYSDRDGQKYEVKGRVGMPKHAISFQIVFPRFEQQFDGYLFTGNGKAIAGTTTIQGRPAGFYATRDE